VGIRPDVTLLGNPDTAGSGFEASFDRVSPEATGPVSVWLAVTGPEGELTMQLNSRNPGQAFDALLDGAAPGPSGASIPLKRPESTTNGASAYREREKRGRWKL
jgi:hypothetical protein